MRKPPRLRDRRLAARDGALDAGAGGHRAENRLGIRRGFFRDADFDRHAVMVAEPQPVALEARRRVEPLDADLAQVLAKPRQVVLEGAEREIVQLLLRALAQNAPAMRVAVGVERDAVAFLAHFEAEAFVEGFCLFEIRHRQAEMVERMHAQDAGPAGGFDEAANLGHRFLC